MSMQWTESKIRMQKVLKNMDLLKNEVLYNEHKIETLRQNIFQQIELDEKKKNTSLPTVIEGDVNSSNENEENQKDQINHHVTPAFRNDLLSNHDYHDQIFEMHLEDKVIPQIEKEKRLHGNYDSINEDDSDEEIQKSQDPVDDNVPFWEDLKLNTTQQVQTSTFNNDGGSKDNVENFLNDLGKKYDDFDTVRRLQQTLVGKRVMLKIKQLEDEKLRAYKKIEMVKKGVIIEKKNIAVQMENKMRDFYRSIIEKFVDLVQKEVQLTFDQTTFLRQDLIQRDKILNKLSQIICAQEQYIEEVRNKIANRDYQGLELFVFVNTVQGGGIIPHSIVQNFKQQGEKNQREKFFSRFTPNQTLRPTSTIVSLEAESNLTPSVAEGHHKHEATFSQSNIASNKSSHQGLKFLGDDQRKISIVNSAENTPREKEKEMVKDKKMHVFKLKVKDEVLLEENKYLRDQFDQLKELTIQWFAEKATLLNKIAFLEHRIRQMSEDNSSKIVELEQQLSDFRKEYEETMRIYEQEKKQYKFEMSKELGINEVLNQRQNEYIEILKKELVIAKNIIKRPRELLKFSRDQGFHRIEIYKYEKVPKSHSINVSPRNPMNDSLIQESVKTPMIKNEMSAETESNYPSFRVQIKAQNNPQRNAQTQMTNQSSQGTHNYQRPQTVFDIETVRNFGNVSQQFQDQVNRVQTSDYMTKRLQNQKQKRLNGSINLKSVHQDSTNYSQTTSPSMKMNNNFPPRRNSINNQNINKMTSDYIESSLMGRQSILSKRALKANQVSNINSSSIMLDQSQKSNILIQPNNISTNNSQDIFSKEHQIAENFY
ncbi:UNKNOWN [Stylonychia lemnae]|uniref:Uncharacterized protein n=1 Tax=Stylonychia lemnae TaxID=5949 RepID=A0A078A3Q6_STYLE|nr:UNKNOWN [Stylonychia lemnae]|eukprot:CDW76163.1 UNKNOWN [Stylonychia lemnae]